MYKFRIPQQLELLRHKISIKAVGVNAGGKKVYSVKNAKLSEKKQEVLKNYFENFFRFYTSLSNISSW